MKKKTNTQTRNRMIHIRLNEEIHKKLKIKAVQNDTTIQELVENLILRSLEKSQGRKI